MLVDGEIFPATERFLGFVRQEKAKLGVDQEPAAPATIETEGHDTTRNDCSGRPERSASVPRQGQKGSA
jgi:hypothetical protein